MKIVITTALSILGFATAFSQETVPTEVIKRNSVYAEAFGQGFCWSLNYDRLFNTEKTFANSFTTGVVYVPKSLEFGDGTYFGVPISYNWLLGKKSHHLEMGVGLTALIVKPYYSSNSLDSYLYASPKIAYRFQRPQGGMFFRASMTAMVDLLNVGAYRSGSVTYRNFSTMNNVVGLGHAVFPWPGLSIGYSF